MTSWCKGHEWDGAKLYNKVYLAPLFLIKIILALSAQIFSSTFPHLQESPSLDFFVVNLKNW
jgi:hypothetical protein